MFSPILVFAIINISIVVSASVVAVPIVISTLDEIENVVVVRVSTIVGVVFVAVEVTFIIVEWTSIHIGVPFIATVVVPHITTLKVVVIVEGKIVVEWSVAATIACEIKIGVVSKHSPIRVVEIDKGVE
eukprot:Gb_39176 [translate_table: standard]